jgi:two-component system sensor histidine kinase KdpD
LVNLLENAAKYTPPASPIRIAARLTDAHVEVSVEDRGPGLPPGRELEIFEKFTRGHPESAVPGVGLGLAICRAIIEAHQGTIRAENRNDGGARFIFALPAAPSPNIEPEIESDAAAA